jgi:hypothetical protein
MRALVVRVTERHRVAPHPQESDMSTTTLTTDVTALATGAGRVTWRRGLLAGLLASVAVTVVAGLFRAAGHPLAVVDGPIPLLGFAQLVLASTVVGIAIARHTSRTTFYRASVALTALSCVPDLAWGDGALSTAGLVLTHAVAAAIIIPRLARR